MEQYWGKEWETIAQDHQERTQRLKVPGGWIVARLVGFHLPPAMAMCFISDPNHEMYETLPFKVDGDYVLSPGTYQFYFEEPRDGVFLTFKKNTAIKEISDSIYGKIIGAKRVL